MDSNHDRSGLVGSELERIPPGMGFVHERDHDQDADERACRALKPCATRCQ
jgi:hypothetical protein